MPMELSSNEKKVIRKITQIQMESLLRLGMSGHDIFDRFCETESAEDLKEGMSEIGLQLIENVGIFEKIEASPELLFELDEMNLLMVRFITHKFVSDQKFPKTKKKLLRKLEIAHNNKKITYLN